MIMTTRSYFRIALQSALAAGLCLGLPAGLLFWLLLYQRTNSSAFIDQVVLILQTPALNKVILLAVCSLMWSYLLGRISGYRVWWHIGIATIIGIFAGWFSPLSNLDGLIGDKLPVHTLYTIAISGLIFSVTSCVGLAYGFILRSIKAAFVIALTTSFMSALIFAITSTIFVQFGILVGSVPFSMSRITATGMLVSAIIGGAILGLSFSWFIDKSRAGL
jgi:hypothetical protein